MRQFSLKILASGNGSSKTTIGAAGAGRSLPGGLRPPSLRGVLSREKDSVGLPRSDLGNASVHEDFASGDEAAVVGGQEPDHLCDIGGNSIPPDRGGAGGLGEKAGQLCLVPADQPGA